MARQLQIQVGLIDKSLRQPAIKRRWKNLAHQVIDFNVDPITIIASSLIKLIAQQHYRLSALHRLRDTEADCTLHSTAQGEIRLKIQQRNSFKATVVLAYASLNSHGRTGSLNNLMKIINEVDRFYIYGAYAWCICMVIIVCIKSDNYFVDNYNCRD